MSVTTRPLPAAGTAAPRERRSLGPLVLRLHFYAGVLVAPFLVVAALTGLAFVFSPQLDRLVYAHELSADPGAGPPRPLAEQVAAARTAHPGGDLASVFPPVEATDTTRVVFSLPELGEKQHTVYVDPYTNEVRGTLTTWFGETPLMTWLDDLHRNLHLGVVGRHYSEVAASWLWVVVLGGLWLWLRRQWTGRRRLRRTVLPDLAAGVGVRRTRSWHAATGVWLAVGLLALSATGLTWSRYAGGNFDVLQEGLNAHSPALETALPGGAAEGGGHHADPVAGGGGADPSHVDRVTIAARRAGLTGVVEVTFPAEPGAAWVVAQDDPSWPTGWDRAAIDPATGAVVARSDFADWPLLAQLAKLGVAFHMGFLFGLLNQLLLAALAIGLLCVIVWGYRMWWQRRPTRADRAALLGTPPARGAWRRTHPAAAVAALLVAVAVGWALPMLGVTLAAFLLVDLILGAARRRRAGRAVPTSPPL
ncbi:PepSY domain-containing protein [Phytohabitans sp. ZYX-F-186]|uniref:PepSY domain-containing protein n=1 Tax=Phytohabitans maris TaxID=3071409 RepID=A0ABU0ZGE8_9ACTN|nr:PepSY domain-containing protein [Phytohabitans sp. ZYX-F-186]MDQ7906100.1 PepSY domain-containing protein [Phytohabitans sp. ZYX-F-186]